MNKNIKTHYTKFEWQSGYGAFSVSQSVVDKTLEYIKNQKAHHARHTFRDEYIGFLQLYGISYDDRYLFTDWRFTAWHLGVHAFALSGRAMGWTTLPRVSLRLPWAMRSLGFQPVSSKNKMRSWNKNHLKARRMGKWKRAIRSLGFQPAITPCKGSKLIAQGRAKRHPGLDK